MPYNPTIEHYDILCFFFKDKKRNIVTLDKSCHSCQKKTGGTGNNRRNKIILIIMTHNDNYIDELAEKIIQCAIKVRMTLAAGYLEKVYENALMIELRNAGIKAEQQVDVKVNYHGEEIGRYTIDILVEDFFVLELKAVNNITVVHETQLVNYLAATGFDVGLIINFGNEKRMEFKRKYRLYRPKGSKNKDSCCS